MLDEIVLEKKIDGRDVHKVPASSKSGFKIITREELDNKNQELTRFMIEHEKAKQKPEPAPIPASKPKIVHKYYLLRVSTNEKVNIGKTEFVVGKSKFSDFQVKQNNTVSRSHAIFHIENNQLFIEDNNSKNGTSVDGKYLKAHIKKELDDGCNIKLSDEAFQIIVE